MAEQITLHVNRQRHEVYVEPDTPLIYVLRNDLGLKGPKFGCGLGQCGACKVLIEGQDVRSCQVAVGSVGEREVTTLEGLGTAGNLHPLQQAFIDEHAVQCGFCASGMIVAAKALLDRHPHPSDEQIRAALAGDLCRCGSYDRILRAVRRAAGLPVSPAGEQRDIDMPPDPAFNASDELPRPLQQTPDLDTWIRINTDGTIILLTGKVELGQDLRTSIAMIGADELDVSLERIRVIMADTAQTANEGYTVSSVSLETSGNAVRYAAAEVRQMALAVAHEELEAPVERLTIEDGTITDPVTGRNVTYWDLFAGQQFGCPVRGAGRPKGPEAYRIVGRPAPRLDLVAKVTGAAHFVHDLDMPGMVHGRVVRPPSYGARLVSADEDGASRLPGVLRLVRDGSFLGLIAEREEQAVRALVALRDSAVWEPGPALPPQETLFDRLVSQPSEAFLLVEGRPAAGPIPPVVAPADAAQTLRATYDRPYHMHASLGPSAAVALWAEGKLTVWTHSQGVYPLRAELAQVLDLPEADIRAIHVDGPGCYGHNGADDAALDAVLLARALPGRPVSLQWRREDEHAWEPYGAATVIQMQASLDAAGEVIDWNHDVWGYTHTSRARAVGGTSGLLAAWYLAEPFSPPQPRPIIGPEVGIHRNAVPLYTFGRQRIVKHFVPDSPLRVSALRGLGAYANIFAIESFMDELAHAAGIDPAAFRLRYLADERARGVIEAAVACANHRPKGQGRGIAFARYKNRQCYVATVVDLSVDRASGRIHLEHAVVAADVGQVVNPEGLNTQLAGGFIQSASWTLKEQVTWSPAGITSVNWAGYPILRFGEAPQVETILLNRPGQPYLGIGEGTQGPISAAIANAIFDAAGIRLRRIPFTPERVREALAGSSASG